MFQLLDFIQVVQVVSLLKSCLVLSVLYCLVLSCLVEIKFEDRLRSRMNQARAFLGNT